MRGRFGPRDRKQQKTRIAHLTTTAVVCGAVVLVLFLAVPAVAQHGMHPPMPDQRFALTVRSIESGADVIEVPLDLPSPTMPSDFSQHISLPNGKGAIHAVRYLPRAVVDQTVEAGTGEGAGPAVRVSIEGPAQSFERWLLGHDAERNRLQSLIGTWRYQAVADKSSRDLLYKQFETELTRDPVIQVRSEAGIVLREIPAKPGMTEKLAESGCTLAVVKFLPHFAIDDKKKTPISISEKRINPAVQVRVSCGQERFDRWLFSRFPEYTPGGVTPLPVPLRLDCPVGSERPIPAFVIITTGGTQQEIWERYEGETTARSLSAGQAVPIANSSYTFSVAKFVASGRLVETYRADESRRAVPAVRIETADAEGLPQSTWIALGEKSIVGAPGSRMVVGFGNWRATSGGGHP